MRLAGKSREREGFSTDITSGRDLDDENVDAWRASLLIRPSENFESLFIYDGMQQRNNGTAVYFGHPATPNPACLATNTCRPIDLYSPPINGFLGLQDAQAIAAEQAGMDHVVRAVANEYGCKGIRVNAIAPGLTDTPMLQGMAQTPGLVAAFAKEYPLGRINTIDDVAFAALFLASDRCFMTGQMLHVTGGLTLRRNPTQAEINQSVQAAMANS